MYIPCNTNIIANHTLEQKPKTKRSIIVLVISTNQNLYVKISLLACGSRKRLYITVLRVFRSIKIIIAINDLTKFLSEKAVFILVKILRKSFMSMNNRPYLNLCIKSIVFLYDCFTLEALLELIYAALKSLLSIGSILNTGLPFT